MKRPASLISAHLYRRLVLLTAISGQVVILFYPFIYCIMYITIYIRRPIFVRYENQRYIATTTA
jgi:hypothetical protein